jgi:hypothetical protein
MRQLFVIAFIATLAFSCNNSGKKEKEPIAKDSATVKPLDSAGNKPATDTPAVADSAKTVKLIFSGYEEGDYAHLMFTETATGIEYDFGHPDEDSLNNIPVVIKDDKTSFGYKENSKMKGAKFTADIVYIMTDTYDGNGQPVKGKEWRIVSLKKDQ